MANFRLQDNVPNYYVDESRDFQLLCRVIDVYLKGCLSKSSIIPYQLDLDKCDEQLLYAIANMQGFTTKKYFPPNILRNILKVFPYCIKRKGTKEAIELASYAVLSTDRLIYYIDVQVTSRTNDGVGDYTIRITCNTQSEYLPYLEELLRFLVPIGWRIEYQLLNTFRKETDKVKVASKSKISRLSGITGKIISISPLIAGAIEEDNFGTSMGTKTGYYSKVGFAKILASKTVSGLSSQTGYLSKSNTAETLININEKENPQTTFIYNNLWKNEEDSSQGGN